MAKKIHTEHHTGDCAQQDDEDIGALKIIDTDSSTYASVTQELGASWNNVPVVVKNHRSELIKDDFNIGEELILDPATVNNHLAALLGNLAPGDVMNLVGSVVKDHNLVVLGTIAEAAEMILSAASVYENDGLGGAGPLLASLAPGESYICPAAPSPSGIAYNIIQPSQRQSYRPGDVGDNIQSGVYDPSNPPYPERYAELDQSNNYPYRMKGNNYYGTLHRFTTDDGTPASDGLANFVIGDFATSTDWYVIDHHHALGVYVANLGFSNWNTYIDDCLALTVGAYSDFRPFSPEEMMGVLNKRYKYYTTNNIFRRGVVSGDTESHTNLGVSGEEFIPATYYYYYNNEGTVRLRSKTSASFAGYALRNHRL